MRDARPAAAAPRRSIRSISDWESVSELTGGRRSREDGSLDDELREEHVLHGLLAEALEHRGAELHLQRVTHGDVGELLDAARAEVADDDVAQLGVAVLERLRRGLVLHGQADGEEQEARAAGV